MNVPRLSFLFSGHLSYHSDVTSILLWKKQEAGWDEDGPHVTGWLHPSEDWMNKGEGGDYGGGRQDHREHFLLVTSYLSI